MLDSKCYIFFRKKGIFHSRTHALSQFYEAVQLHLNVYARVDANMLLNDLFSYNPVTNYHIH